MVGRSVVRGDRQIPRQHVRIVKAHAASARRLAARSTRLRINPLNGRTTRQYRVNFRREAGSDTWTLVSVVRLPRSARKSITAVAGGSAPRPRSRQN